LLKHPRHQVKSGGTVVIPAESREGNDILRLRTIDDQIYRERDGLVRH